MSSNLTPQDIAECICALIARNKLWSGKKVHVNFIVNTVQHHQQNRVSSMDTAPVIHSQHILKYNTQRTRTGIIKASLKSRN